MERITLKQLQKRVDGIAKWSGMPLGMIDNGGSKRYSIGMLTGGGANSEVFTGSTAECWSYLEGFERALYEVAKRGIRYEDGRGFVTGDKGAA